MIMNISTHIYICIYIYILQGKNIFPRQSLLYGVLAVNIPSSQVFEKLAAGATFAGISWLPPSCCSSHRRNDSHRSFINIDAFYLRITTARRSLGYARCCHSIIFEPDAYKTCRRSIIFSKISLSQQKKLIFQNIRYQVLASKILATRSCLPDPGYQILASMSLLPDPGSRSWLLHPTSWLQDPACQILATRS